MVVGVVNKPDAVADVHRAPGHGVRGGARSAAGSSLADQMQIR